MSLQGPGRQPNNGSSMSVAHIGYPGPPIRGAQPMAAYAPTGAMPPGQQQAFRPNGGQYMMESMMRAPQAVGGYGAGGPQFAVMSQRPLRPMMVRQPPPSMTHQQEFIQHGMTEQQVYNAIRMPHPQSQPAPAMPLAPPHPPNAWAVQQRAMPPSRQPVITVRQTVAPNVTVEYPVTAVMQPGGSDSGERSVEVMQQSYVGHYGRYPQPQPQSAMPRQSDSSEVAEGYPHWQGQSHTGPYFGDANWQGQSSAVQWPARPESLYQARAEPPPPAPRPSIMYAPRDMGARHPAQMVPQFQPRLQSPGVEPMHNYVIYAGRSQVPAAYGQGQQQQQQPYAQGYVQDRGYPPYGQNVTEMGEQTVETEEDRYSQNQAQNFVTNQPPSMTGAQLQYAGHKGGTLYEVGYTPPAHATQFAYENNTAQGQNTVPTQTTLHNTVPETVQASRPKRTKNALKIIDPNTGEEVTAFTTKQQTSEGVPKSERRSPLRLQPAAPVGSREPALEFPGSVDAVSSVPVTLETSQELLILDATDVPVVSDAAALPVHTDSESVVISGAIDSESISCISVPDENLVSDGIEPVVDVAASQWEVENQPSAVSDTDSGCIRDNDETGSQEANEPSPVDSRLRRLSSDTLTTPVGVGDEDTAQDVILDQKLLMTEELESEAQVISSEVCDHEDRQEPESVVITAPCVETEEMPEEKEEYQELVTEEELVCESDDRGEMVEEPKVLPVLEPGEVCLQPAVEEKGSEELEELTAVEPVEVESGEVEDLISKELEDEQPEAPCTTETTEPVPTHLDERLPLPEHVEEVPSAPQHMEDTQSAEPSSVHSEELQTVEPLVAEEAEERKKKKVPTATLR